MNEADMLVGQAPPVDPIVTLQEEFPDPLSVEVRNQLDLQTYGRYMGAMSTRISEDNPLYLSVVSEGESFEGHPARQVRTLVGTISGGFGIAQGKQDVLGVLVSSHQISMGTLLFKTDEIGEYIPSPLSTEGAELGEGMPDFRYKTLLLHTTDFCLVLPEVDIFAAEYGVSAGPFFMIGPVLAATRQLAPGDLDNYDVATGGFDWGTYLQEIAQAQITEESATELQDTDSTTLT
jgi:hypothetical protein